MCPLKWRKEILKITLSDLAKLMPGVSASYISRVERGVESPSGKILTHYHRLSKGEVTPSDFKGVE